MRKFPFKLLRWMLFGYLIGLLLVSGLVLIFVELFDVHLSLEKQLVAAYVVSFSVFVIVSILSLQPISNAVSYLQLLLNQPKTENIRVEDGGELSQVFRRGEWIELGELFRQVERKLRRRTKALLRETTELSAVMNSLDSPIIAITKEMEVSFMNSAFAVLLDVQLNTDQKLDQPLKAHNFIKDQGFIASIEHAFEYEVFEKKIIPLLIGGRKRVFTLSMSPLRRSDRSLYGVVASLNDETIKIELDQKKMDFVANASHELRTPITAISTSVSLLKKVEEAELKDQIIESLDLNSKRLVSLAHELLDLSRLEREEESLNCSYSHLQKLSEEVLESLTHPDKDLVEIKTINVEQAYFDESKVKQVLTNLVRNALIYTPPETKVEVSWRLEEAALLLSVKDWGAGISEAEVNRIFERFYRVDKSRSRKVGGSGLGLSIVKHIMNLHQGDVGLSTKTGNEDWGAEFVCSFPVGPFNA